MKKRFFSLADEKGVSNIPLIGLLALAGFLFYGQMFSTSADLPELLRSLLAH